MLTLLLKIITQPFYKANAGFFVFFFFLFFCTVQPHSLIPYHYALIQGIIQSPVVTSGVLFLWLLYNNKSIGFIKRILTSNEGRFLHVLGTLSAKSQWFLLIIIQLSLYAPVLIYSIVLMSVAYKEGMPVYIPLLIGFHIIVFAGSIRLYYNWINNKESRKFFFHWPVRKKTAQSYWLYLLSYCMNERKISVAVIKIYSFLVLYIMLVYNKLPITSSDFILPFLTILWAHIVLCFWLVRFMEKELQFFRNLPLARFRVAALYLFTHAVLFLPEFLFLSVSQAFSTLSDCIIFYLLTVATMALFTSIQYNEQVNMGEYIKVIFIFSFVSIFFMLTHNYSFLLLVEFIISALLFKAGYYTFQINDASEVA